MFLTLVWYYKNTFKLEFYDKQWDGEEWEEVCVNVLRYCFNCLVLISFLISIAPVVYGGTASILGLSSRASAMGGAMTAVSNDYTAAFYNPALLSEALKGGEWLQTGATFMYTTRDFQALDASQPPVIKDFQTTGFACGFTIDPYRLVGIKKFRFGVSFYLPTGSFLTLDVAENSTIPYFPVYDEICTTMSAYSGVAYSISDKLSFGAGVNLLAKLPNADTHIMGYIDATELLASLNFSEILEDAEIDASEGFDASAGVNREMVVITGFHAGAVAEVLDWLKLGASYREELYGGNTGNQYLHIIPLNTDGSINNVLASRLPIIRLPMFFAMYYSPTEYSLGAGIKISNFLIDFDITYALWSGYIDQRNEAPDDEFLDTWNPRIGMEYLLNPKITLWCGYVFRPTPIPEQTSQSSYLDSDTYTLCFGGEYKIGHGRLQLHAQYHVMGNQDLNKIEDNQGTEYTNITYEGSLLNTGISYVLEF